MAVIAGTLALIYVFVIKPALDTSKEISEQIGSGANDVSRSIQQSIRQQVPSSANQQIQQQINQALQQTSQPEIATTPSVAKRRRLKPCRTRSSFLFRRR